MNPMMTLGTKPFHIERTAIIGMMSVDILVGRTNPTGLLLKFTIADSIIDCIMRAIGFRMILTPFNGDSTRSLFPFRRFCAISIAFLNFWIEKAKHFHRRLVASLATRFHASIKIAVIQIAIARLADHFSL